MNKNDKYFAKIDKEFNALGLNGAFMVDKMHMKFNIPMDFAKAAEVVTEAGDYDMLLGMERIKAIRIDELFDEEIAEHKTYLVSAYRVVFSNMSKLFN